MGHYLSEMQDSTAADRRYRQAMADDKLRNGGYQHWNRMADLYLHIPCGLIVGDPSAHDKCCPAKTDQNS